MVAHSLFWGALLWYNEQVFPGYGVGRPWHLGFLKGDASDSPIAEASSAALLSDPKTPWDVKAECRRALESGKNDEFKVMIQIRGLRRGFKLKPVKKPEVSTLDPINNKKCVPSC
jgi:hypothetical protein